MTRIEKLCYKANQYAIAGFFGDVNVKCSISRKVGFLSLLLRIHRLKDPFEFLNVVIAHLTGSHSSGFTFNGDASPHDLQRPLVGRMIRKGPLRFADKNARSRSHIDQALDFKRNESFPNRRSGNLELLS